VCVCVFLVYSTVVIPQLRHFCQICRVLLLWCVG